MVVLFDPCGVISPDRHAPFSAAKFQIMQERVRALSANLGIRLQVTPRAERGTGIAALLRAAQEVMRDRVDLVLGDVGMLLQVPSAVEQTRLFKKRDIAL